MIILNQAIAAAISPAQVSGVFSLPASPRNLAVQFNFTYGAGGTTVDAYLQTSFDGGVTWIDIANFHATTAALRKAINLNSQTPETTQVAVTDGSLAANTAQDGLLGPQYRVKYQSSGTYTGATNLTISVAGDLITQ